MEPSPHPTFEERVTQLQAIDARQTAWRLAAALLIGLITLNAVTVIYTRSPFSAWFVLVNSINLLLAVGLAQLRSWARYLTVLRALLGMLLALTGVAQGALIDFVITALLLTGIALPLIGRPRPVKNVVAAVLFAAGVFATMAAVISRLVVVS